MKIIKTETEALFLLKMKAKKSEGAFLVKVFQGTDYEAFLKLMRETFKTVVVRKPDASRDRSAELYLLGRTLR